ncbi:SCO1860 family LAETG-anchored protein [Streptomyces sp. ST2-7A]|uniref:SCO1860 family LAETG-anchored protein n=1 Tax=Streptomyces sp. ST2-7A TaxID=2907214 RepID=UPI001F41D81B|nr:SCO1860 family LAETG-anchored protein [Streptomyces sp. ST2-7A]MCE7082224.1 hypothetical protein [Streptomyces sp. ST2-7A]
MFRSACSRTGARRAAVLLTTVVLLSAGAAPALALADKGGRPPADGGAGAAGAAVLRTGLDVALLNRSVELPLFVSLNEVTAPSGEAVAEKTTLTATLDGVDDGTPFRVLDAEVATARAAVDDVLAEAEADLVDAVVHVPGLSLVSVVEVDAVSARVHCPAEGEPTAEVELPGAVTVLGQRVTTTAEGETSVRVPGVGEVRLDLAVRSVTGSEAAAAALELAVEVNPLDLNVAEVEGRITLAEVSCASPVPVPADRSVPAEPQAPADPAAEEPEAGDPRPRTVARESERSEEPGLAATGGDAATPWLAGGAAVLLGAGSLLMIGRRRSAAHHD